MATVTAQRRGQIGRGMAYRAIWSATLRAYRVPILAWGIGLGLMVMATAAASTSISSSLGGSSTTQLLQDFRFFGEPVAMTTPQGYTTFKILGLLPLFLGIWTVIAGGYLTRGEEERHSLDLLLGEPISRLRALGEKVVAFALGTLIIGLLVGLGLSLGLASAKLPADPGGSLLAGLNFALTAFVYGALAIFISQFTRRAGAAAGIAGAYMAIDFVVAGAARSTNGLDWLGRITINYYSELSKPIIASYGANLGAMLVLLAASVVLIGASFWLFARRDVGDVTPILPRGVTLAASVAPATAIARAERDGSLRGIVSRTVGANWTTIAWWAFGIGLFGLYGVVIAKAALQAMSDAIAKSPVLQHLFSGNDMTTNNGFIAGIIFSFTPFVVTLAAIFFALNWASDLDQGQMETTLSNAPIARWRVPLERYSMVVVGSVALALVTFVGAWLGSVLTGLTIDYGALLRAALAMIPLMLLAGSLVFALAGKLGSGTILGLVGGLASLSFILELLRSFFTNMPGWIMNLSIFHVYGQPMTGSVNGTGTIVMLALAAALLALGTWLFTQADLRQ
ncbi:MAG: ABC transporter permease subunit [Chloroflexota bacterium]|nr:ABC transporter permease subunit [Chloroflexota bacterium]